MTPFSSILVSRLFPRFVSVAFCVILMVTVWEAKAQSTGAAWRYLGPDGANVTHIAASGDTLYAATSTGALFRSTNGISWTQVSSLSAPRGAMGLAAATGNVIVSYAAPIFPTDDVGGTWFVFSTNGGVSALRSFSGTMQIRGLALRNDRILVADSRGITERGFVQSFSGNSTVLLTNASLSCLAAVDSLIYVGSQNSEVLRSTNNGRTWTSNATPFIPRSFVIQDSQNFFAASTNAVFMTSDGGTRWQQTGNAPSNTSIQAITRAFGGLFAATNNGVFRSADSGRTWLPTNQGLSTQNVSQIISNDSATFVRVGNAWLSVTSTSLVPYTFPTGQPASFRATPTFLFAFTDSTIWRSRNGREWQQVGVRPSGFNFGKIVENDRLYFVATVDGIYRSTDSGRTWQSAWLKGRTVFEFGVVADTIYATSLLTQFPSVRALLRSTDAGKSWQENGLLGATTSSSIDNILSFRQRLYSTRTTDFYTSFTVATDMYRLSGMGNTISQELIKQEIFDIATRKNEILLLSKMGVAEKSTDGQSWQGYTRSGLTNTNFTSFAANNQSIFVGTNGGLYILDAPATTVSVKESPALSPEWRISPQPAHDSFTLTFSLPASAHVRCTLHTVLGQEIATLADNAYASGQHETTAAVPNMASGLYICRVAVNGRVVGSKSVIITR